MKRWINRPIDDDIPLLLPAGGITILGYKDQNLSEPVWQTGVAL
jgi:hypothetical protein